MNIKNCLRTATLAAAALAGPAFAGVVFSDNFDADNNVSALNFNSLLNWNVSEGTIDYIRNGGWGINCVGNSGGCLDMDGSTGNAGRITSKQSFSFASGTQYTIEMAVSGNQRGGSADSLSFGLIDAAGAVKQLVTPVGPLAWNAAFNTYSVQFAGSSVAGSWRLFVEGNGGDNVGPILDNYVLRDDRNGAVPEPGSLALAALALIGAGMLRRRRVS